VHISKAGRWDVVRHLETTTVLKLIGAGVAGAGAIASGVVGILESSASLGIIALILILVFVGASLTGYSSIRDAVDVDCGG